MKKEIGFATYYRVLGMVCILLCHFVQESSNPNLNMSAQLFNIGVEMFFILSGYLFGMKQMLTGGQSAAEWYKRRIKRIFVPYELFVIVLLIVHILTGRTVLRIDWLLFAAGLQGSVVGVQGGEQTWFISALLLCYFITPAIHSLTTANSNQKLPVFIFCVLPAVFAVVPANWVSVLFAPICLYSLAYIAGRNAVRIPVAKKYIPLSACIMCAMFAIRLGARIVCDGTLLYDKIIVFYTQSVASAAIFYIVAAFTGNRTPGKVMTYLSSISFEIYLFHYMFCVGPVRVFGLTGNWCVNCVIVLTVTAMIAAVMHAIANKVMRK